MSMSMKSQCYTTSYIDGKCEGSDKRPECQERINECRLDIHTYHLLCDPYWNLKGQDIERMVDTEVELAITRLDTCINLRDSHIKKCVHIRCRDKSHKGAVFKLKAIQEKLIKVRDGRLTKNISIYKKITEATTGGLDSETDLINLLAEMKGSQESTEAIIFPALPDPRYSINYKQFLQSIADGLGVEIIYIPSLKVKGGGEYNLIGIPLASGQTAVEVVQTSLGSQFLYKRLSDTLVNTFADKEYQDLYHNRYIEF